MGEVGEGGEISENVSILFGVMVTCQNSSSCTLRFVHFVVRMHVSLFKQKSRPII